MAWVGMAGLDFASLMAFDTALDRFWNATRQRCYFWINFDHDDLDLLSEEEQDQLDLEDKREKATSRDRSLPPGRTGLSRVPAGRGR